LGAFLVSVPDPDGPAFPAEAASFKAPDNPLPFPALIVASTTDPFGTLEYSQTRSREWRTGLVVAGALGHINAASGLADWPQGVGLFQAFCAGLGRA
jgi:predicted alpha/beta hydrolase family esterase